ncbi:MAG TPA: glycoside hydrolase family 43 protein [Candidatus Saccharimonadales bacterium]|nr:glycoside hydrolase family 43 protein [Candidatus Saccharimonadales bacterium]
MLSTPATRIQPNPVYSGYFADPFVWQFEGEYFAIGTGLLEASGKTLGKIFSILHSRDLWTWQFASHALNRPEAALGNTFWAPEVAYSEGKFYLYYSVGFEDREHQLRVAVSERPQGPYEDTGKALLDSQSCPFAIDPHPFRDDDGQWHLFYARDFLDSAEGHRAGTGLAVARLKSMTELENIGAVVLRATRDWQRFQSNRPMYGQTFDWHTLEGPCVRKKDGLYYCFYSGGRWETQYYGVDYAVAKAVDGPYSEEGNETGARVLKTIPGEVLGPGHNSIITGPDGETEYMVYHAWDKNMKARQMFVDKLIWTPAGPRCDGPTWDSSTREAPLTTPTL